MNSLSGLSLVDHFYDALLDPDVLDDGRQQQGLFDDYHGENLPEVPSTYPCLNDMVLLMNDVTPQDLAKNRPSHHQTELKRFAIERALSEQFLGRKKKRSSDFRPFINRNHQVADWVKVYGSHENLSKAIIGGAFKRKSEASELIKAIDEIGAWKSIAIMQEGRDMIRSGDFHDLKTWCSCGTSTVNARLLHNIAVIQRGLGMISRDDFQVVLDQVLDGTGQIDMQRLAHMAQTREGKGVRQEGRSLEKVDRKEVSTPETIRTEERVPKVLQIRNHYLGLPSEKQGELKKRLGALAKAWQKNVKEAVATTEKHLLDCDQAMFDHYQQDKNACPSSSRSTWMKAWWSGLQTTLNMKP